MALASEKSFRCEIKAFLVEALSQVSQSNLHRCHSVNFTSLWTRRVHLLFRKPAMWALPTKQYHESKWESHKFMFSVYVCVKSIVPLPSLVTDTSREREREFMALFEILFCFQLLNRLTQWNSKFFLSRWFFKGFHETFQTLNDCVHKEILMLQALVVPWNSHRWGNTELLSKFVEAQRSYN